jgi:hypothetical protein
VFEALTGASFVVASNNKSIVKFAPNYTWSDVKAQNKELFNGGIAMNFTQIEARKPCRKTLLGG